jgi:hypothetical protein
MYIMVEIVHAFYCSLLPYCAKLELNFINVLSFYLVYEYLPV